MPVYNFKSMKAVPTAMELIDIVLMRTQRRTPTIIHPGYKITRIRSFYMRKIKFTQQTISERLSQILIDFPRLNDIHPFYSDLCNTLYDRDHYKLALGQINMARTLVDNISKDMIRMIKYGDSLYRCKCLKRAALGRMCTVLKRQKASLAYLEEVRKHLSRLPALDPNTRTLLLCGFPNVGKSSFMNKITRGNVDVQSYPFTTKSLFVGHCDYKYLRWQVIDTPGILDHSLEERNTIEMQSIIALAHLTCSVLYFIDISEQCGYSIEQQCSLFQQIKPLFANKQLVVVVNKIDQQPWETLDSKHKHMIEELVHGQQQPHNGGSKISKSSTTPPSTNCSLMTMSNISEHGVSAVKMLACDKLLTARVDSRIAANKVDAVMNRLTVFYPKPRDNVKRDVCIPESVIQTYNQPKPKRSKIGYAPTIHDSDDEDVDVDDDDDDSMEDEDEDGDMSMMSSKSKKSSKSDGAAIIIRKKTARDLMWENGGPGVWAPDYREQYDLKNDLWRFDKIPEIMNGKNIADYVDSEIMNKLYALEKEEEQIIKTNIETAAIMEDNNNNNNEDHDDDDSDLDSREDAIISAIRSKKKKMKIMKSVHKTQNRPMMPRSIRGRSKNIHERGISTLDAKEMKRTMDALGIDSTKMIERGRSRERIEHDRKRERSLTKSTFNNNNKDMDVDDDDDDDDKTLSRGQQKKLKRERSLSVRREISIARSHSQSSRRTPSQMGIKDDPDVIKKVEKLERHGQRKTWMGGAGEGDQRKSVHLVKWMNTGKKRMGTHYCR